MKRLFLIMLGLVAMVTGASAAITAGTYTIQPYSASSYYVCGSETFNTTGGTKAAYSTVSSTSDYTYWTLTASDAGYYSIKSTDKGLNAWDASTDGGDVCADLPGYCYWDIQPVEGKENTYTLYFKAAGGNTSNLYMCYESDKSNLRYKQMTTPDESCYFILKPVNRYYTANVIGSVAATNFVWTPSKASGDEILARSASLETSQSVGISESIYTETAESADEFSLTGVTGLASEKTPTVSMAVDPENASHYIVKFEYPYAYTWSVSTKTSDGTGTADNPTSTITATCNSTTYTYGTDTYIFSANGTKLAAADITQNSIDGYQSNAATVDNDNLAVTINYQVHVSTPVGYTNAAPKFYRLKNLRSGKYACWTSVAGGTSHVKQITSDNFATEGANAIWYFISNAGTTEVTNDYYIYNLSDETQRLLYPNNARVTAAYDNTTLGQLYYVYAQSAINGSNTYSGFAIHSNTTFTADGSWNDYQGTGTYVTKQTGDWGSIWDYEEVPVSEAFSYWEAANETTSADDYDIVEGSVFGPTSTQVSTYKTAIAAAYTTAYDATLAGWDENKAAIATLVSAAKTTCETGWTTTFPTTGGKYIIRQAGTGRGYYLTDNGTMACMTSTDTRYAAANVWEFIPTSTSGKFRVRNRNTGKFLSLSTSASGASSLVESLNRDNAVELSVTNISGTAKGAIHRSANSDLTSTTSSMHASSWTNNQVITYKAEGDLSYWILYPITTDIIETGKNYLIHSKRYSNEYMGYESTDSKVIVHKATTVNGENGVWTVSAGSDDDSDYDYSIGVASNDAAKLKSVDSSTQVWTVDGTGSNVYVQTHPYNNGYYLMSFTNNKTTKETAFDCQDSYAIGTYSSYGASDYDGTSWSFESFDRMLDDARYNLKTNVLDPVSSYTHASDYFYVNTDKYDTYEAYLTETYTNATEYTLYKKVADKVAAGIVYGDYNIPADGYYVIKNKNRNGKYYLGEDLKGEWADYSSVNHLITTPTQGTTSLFKLTHNASDNTVALQNVKTGRYLPTEVPYQITSVSSDDLVYLNLVPAKDNAYGYAGIQGTSIASGNNFSNYYWGADIVTGYNGTSDCTKWEFIPVADQISALKDSVSTRLTASYDADNNTKPFYLSEAGNTLYSGYVTTASGDLSAYTQDDYATLYQNLVTFKAEGPSNAYLNLSSFDGTSGLYSIKHVLDGFYGYCSKTSDTAGNFSGTTDFTSANFMNIAFSRGSDEELTATVQDAATSFYLNNVPTTTKTAATFGTVADGESAYSFKITPAIKMDGAGKGAIIIGNQYAPYNSNTAFFHHNSSTIGNVIEWNCTVANANWSAAAWTINTISEEAAKLIVKADALKDNASGHTSDLFYLTESGVTKITTDETALGEDGASATLATYKALEADLKDGTLYNLPSSGRYWIKNKATQTYLNNYAMLIQSGTTSFYDTWYFTKTEDKNEYTFLNEGAAYIMEPLSEKYVSDLDATAKAALPKYLGFLGDDATTAYAYVMSKDAATMEFLPLGDGTARMHAKDDSYYCVFDNLGTEAGGGGIRNSQRGASTYDETFKSGITENDKEIWTVEAVDNTTDAEMFYRNIYTNKVGYCGGPITLTNVDAISALKNIKDAITAEQSTISDATAGTSFTQADGTYATAYATICQSMLALKKTGEGTSAYYLWPDPAKTFYFENYSRPSFKARLVNASTLSYQKTNEVYGTSEDVVADNNTAGQWTFEAVTGDDATTYSGGYYVKNVATGLYMSTTASDNFIQSTDDTSTALIIELKEVVPGVYMMFDMRRKAVYDNAEDKTTDDCKYTITITDKSSGWGLKFYNHNEASAHWKIYSINALNPTITVPADMAGHTNDEGTLTTYPMAIPSYSADGTVSGTVATATEDDVTNGKAVKVGDMYESSGEEGAIIYGTPRITTFSNGLTTSASATYNETNGLVAPFYAKSNCISYTDDGKWIITLTEVPVVTTGSGATQATNRYLQNNQGYVLLATQTYKSDQCIILSGVDVTSTTYNKDDVRSDNVLKPNLTPTEIDDSNYRSIYVLSYVASGTVIGTYKGENVVGVGTGFYHLKKGKTLGAGKAYLPSSALPASARAMAGSSTDEESVSGFKLRFELQNGTTTCIDAPVIDTEKVSDAEGDMNIYDLNGHVVDTPERGHIYILNGKKVLF